MKRILHLVFTFIPAFLLGIYMREWWDPYQLPRAMPVTFSHWSQMAENITLREPTQVAEKLSSWSHTAENITLPEPAKVTAGKGSGVFEYAPVVGECPDPHSGRP